MVCGCLNVQPANSAHMQAPCLKSTLANAVSTMLHSYDTVETNICLVKSAVLFFTNS